MERLHQALVLGIKDFVRKTGFQRVHLGLSGGIDSALVACLAVDALGPQNVSTIAMPSPFNSENSLKWAKSLAHNLNVIFEKLSISETYEVALKNYETTFGSLEFGLVHENMQSRLRNLFLMAYSNHHSSLLLNTSNKSEMAVGYSTLYGDMSGALSPIGDLLKRDVYSLSQFYNQRKVVIPLEIIDRPPSAELRPHQEDKDNLPDYPELDDSIERLIEKKEILPESIDKEVLQMLYRSEFKRWQAPPILKVKNHSFGRGRRMPISSGQWK